MEYSNDTNRLCFQVISGLITIKDTVENTLAMSAGNSIPGNLR